MNEYYVTFGFKYHNVTHPLGSWVDPDGYLTIEAESYGMAREKIFDITDGQFAFMYTVKPRDDLFPMGELKRIKA